MYQFCTILQLSKNEVNGDLHQNGSKVNADEEDAVGTKLFSKVSSQELQPDKDFKKYRAIHKDERKSLKCLLCNIKFKRKQSLLLHIVNSNHVQTVDSTFEKIAHGLDTDDLREFRATLHTCPDCGKQFTKPSLLKVHQLVHMYDKNKANYVCNICNNEFSQSLSLKVHLVKVHGADIEMPADSGQQEAKLLTCEFCGKEFHRESSLLVHRKTHTQDETHCRSLQEQDFGGNDEFQKNVSDNNHKVKKDRGKADKKSWQCELCGEVFSKKGQYFEHFNSHEEEEGFKCPECGRYFKKKENLKWHMATTRHTFKDNVNISSADIATSLFGMKVSDRESGKKSSEPSSIQSHSSTQKGKKSYECKDCGEGFTRKYQLTDHLSQCHLDRSKQNKQGSDGIEKKGKGLYTCPKCNKNYSTPVSLRAHIARHDGMKFKCNDCGKLFMRKESLQMHVVREGHNMGKDLTEFSKKLLPCKICGKKLLRPSLLIKHMKSHTGKAPSHFCRKCLEVFETEEEKQEHSCPLKHNPRWKSDENFRAVEDDKRDSSQILQEQQSITDIQEDGNQSLEETYKNMSVDELESLLKMTGDASELLSEGIVKDKADTLSSTVPVDKSKGESEKRKPDALKDAKSAHRMRAYFINKALRLKSEKGKFKKDGKTYYKCSYCPKYFARRGVTQNHERRHTGSKPFNCSTCGRAFSMIQTLKNHMLTHAEEKPHKCSICNKGFVQKPSLIRHMFMHTGQMLPHKCDICNKAFYREGELKKHKEKHEGLSPKVSHICEQCGKSFCTKQGLKNHAMLHEPVKKYYTCEVCNRQFTMAIRLKKHMLVHSDERPFICNYCGKRFARSHYLTNHIRVHTGEKKFKCSYCSKGFTTSGQLSIHTRSHTGEKPYACSICGKRSTDSANHIKHMRTHQDKNSSSAGNHGNSKHRASNNTTSSQVIDSSIAVTNTNTVASSTANIHINQDIERQLTTLHPDNLVTMKQMRPLDNGNMLQPIHNPMQLSHNPLPPEAHGHQRFTRPANFFNPMATGHLHMPNTSYTDGNHFVFRYNDRI